MDGLARALTSGLRAGSAARAGSGGWGRGDAPPESLPSWARALGWEPRRPDAAAARATLQACFNTRVNINCCAPSAMVATVDPDDRAHGVRDGSFMGGGLLPARMVKTAAPRRYHPTQMVRSGEGPIAIDSAMERLDAARRRMGLPAPPSMGRATHAALAMVEARAERAGTTMRDLLHRRTRQEMTPAEVALERRGAELAERGRVGGGA